MDLIKENKEKQRKVYKSPTFYRKVWEQQPFAWEEHLELLDKFMPGFVLDYGNLYIDYKIISGVPANTFPHTKEFIDKIYNFCINNINTTSPYAHGDWVLSNILIDDDDIHIIDWDNVGIYSPTEILEKLHSDLKLAFGDKFDPPSI